MNVHLRRSLLVILSIALLVGALAACRNETQNRIRRSIQDFTSVRMYITVLAYDGTVVFEGLVDGKPTRSSALSDDGNDPQTGSYIFWYDERGRYHQTNLPYMVTTYDRGVQP